MKGRKQPARLWWALPAGALAAVLCLALIPLHAADDHQVHCEHVRILAGGIGVIWGCGTPHEQMAEDVPPLVVQPESGQ